MPTPAQIDEQIQLERDQISYGLKKLRTNTKNLEEKEYASASVYGASSIDTLLPLVVTSIEKTFDYKIKRGKNGVAYKDIVKYISHIEPLALAAIACKLTFDKVFGAKMGCNIATHVCESIGIAVERECQMRHYESCAPGLLITLKKVIVLRVSPNSRNLTNLLRSVILK